MLKMIEQMALDGFDVTVSDHRIGFYCQAYREEPGKREIAKVTVVYGTGTEMETAISNCHERWRTETKRRGKQHDWTT